MTIATATRRCSYYLVLIASLGRTGVVFAAETEKTSHESPAVNGAKAPQAKPKTQTASPQKNDSKPNWVAAPPGAPAAPIDKPLVPNTNPNSALKPVDNQALPGTAHADTATSKAPVAAEPEAAEVCPPAPPIAPDGSRSDTYKGVPFQSGEEARYILKYGLVKVHVGYGFLRVMPPNKYTMAVGKKDGTTVQESRWHRVFSAEAYTGDWYKMIFAGHDKMQAFSRPWDFGVTKFYISQNEEKPFVRRFHAEKWLDFDHVNCSVHERTVDHKKKREKTEDNYLQPAAVDALGALYKLRTLTWELNKTERILVYTSEKNWWLEATPIAAETLATAAGTFKTYKLAVKTYLGKELQQRGKLFVWIAADHPNRPMVRVEGEVTFGSIYLELDRFTVGAS